PIAAVSLDEKLAYTGEGDLVGVPLAGVSVRVDEQGQLLVRGDQLFTCYSGQPPVQEHATGDLARLDAGRIVLLGRAKDMIIRAEHNIYPALYEPLVERVTGVRRAALVGDFDETLADERVILVVEPEDGVEEADLLARVAKSVREGPDRLDS
ncbi:acyl--CoA ligase, partial [Bradyrhizobium sp. NBAIM08]